MAAPFDTLRAARRLKEAGASDEIAEAIAETVRDAREFDLAQLATKADLAALDARITAVEQHLIKWVIGVGVAALVTIVVSVQPDVFEAASRPARQPDSAWARKGKLSSIR